MVECLRKSKNRQKDDMERYSTLYGIDLDDMSPYSLVIDADEKDELEVFQSVDSELGR